MEVFACVASIAGMLGSVKKLVHMIDQVNQSRSNYWYTIKRLLRSLDLIDELLKRMNDLEDLPELRQSLSDAYYTIERLTSKASELLKERKGIKAIKTYVLQWWKLDDICLELQRVKEDLDDCLRHFMLAGQFRVEVQTHKMTTEVFSISQAMTPMMVSLHAQAKGMAGVRQAEELYPSQTKFFLGMNTMSKDSKLGRNDNAEADINLLVGSVKNLQIALGNKLPGRPPMTGDAPPAKYSSSVSHKYIPTICNPNQERKDAIAETLRITAHLSGENSSMSPEELGHLLSRLGLTLVALGWRDQAVAILEWDVQVHRRLCEERPLVYQPQVASSLHNLSVALWNVDQQGPALKAIEEAVEIYKELSSKFPASFEQDLARSLTVLSNQSDKVGRKEDAMKFIEAAVGIFRKMASDYPADFEADLASALHNYSHRLSEAGRKDEALNAISDAIVIRRVLVRDFPKTFEADLALSLVSLSGHLSRAKRKEDAAKAIQEAVNLHQQLAQDRPRVFEPILISSLISLSFTLSKLSRKGEALGPIQEAVQLLQKTEEGSLRGSGTMRQLEGLAKHYKALGWDEHSSCIETGLSLRKA